MSPEGQQLMNEMQRLFKDQAALLDQHFADADQLVKHRIIDSETRIDHCINEAEQH